MPDHGFPNLTVLTHPLIQHKLSILRDRETSTRDFKQLVSEIAMLMAYEVTKDLATETVEIETPLERTSGRQVSGKKLTLVPILRAGLGMVEGIAQLVPSARVGHIGLYRDHDTLRPVDYYFKIPAAEVERDFFVLDPMLATGGSAVAAGRAPCATRAPGASAFSASWPRPKGVQPHAGHPSRRAALRRLARPRAQRARLHPAGTGRRRRPAVRHPEQGAMSAIRLTFWGAAGQVTGSMHLLEAAGGALPARRRALPGPPGGDPRAQRPAAVRSPPDRRRRAEPRPHRPLRAGCPLLVARGLSRADLRHARHPRPLRGHAARLGPHPGKGRRVPPAARQGGRRERAALHAWPTRWRCRS